MMSFILYGAIRIKAHGFWRGNIRNENIGKNCRIALKYVHIAYAISPSIFLLLIAVKVGRTLALHKIIGPFLKMNILEHK